jgi:hypothetical protein
MAQTLARTSPAKPLAAAADYRDVGFVVFDDAIPMASDWAQRFLDSAAGSRVHLAERDRTVEAGGGDNNHRALDRFTVDAVVPEVGLFYPQLLLSVRHAVSRYAILGPYRRSGYYVKIYEQPGDAQGWHFDTNSISAIAYLTTNATGATEINGSDGRTHLVYPEAGRLLLLDGRRCWHRAQPVEQEVKVTLLLDYYLLGHRLRKLHLDRLIFGN